MMNELVRRISDFLAHPIALVPRTADSSVDLSVVKISAEGALDSLPEQAIQCVCKLELMQDLRRSKVLVRRLGRDIVNYATLKMKGQPLKQADYPTKSPHQAIDWLLEKHQFQFTDMAMKMIDNKPEDISESLIVVADKMFRDMQCNCRRIFTLYIFAACLKVYYDSSHDVVRKIDETVGTYVVNNLTEWICSHGRGVNNV